MRLGRGSISLVFALAVLTGGAARGEAPWWNPAWPFRIPVSTAKGEGEAAVLTVSLAGRGQAEGNDLRLVTGEGRLVPIQLLFHDATRSVIAFPAEKAGAGSLFLYFGNLKAPAYRPEVGFELKAGVLLRVYRKPRESNPPDVGAYERLKLESRLEGAGCVAGVSMGYNPFGEAQHYLATYDAYLRLDSAGKYGFCTASDDGSFVFIDDQLVTQWPGGHGVWEGARGEHNGTIELSKGVHHVRYLHDAGPGDNVAFLGWKPPGRERFEPIPPGQYTAVRTAEAGVPEAHGKRFAVFPSARMLTSLWVPESTPDQRKQLSLVELTASVANARGKTVRVRFELGDGLAAEQEVSGNEAALVKHVYARVGQVNVKVRAESEGGSDEIAFAVALPFQDAQAPGMTQGSEQEYIELGGRYDFTKWDLADLERFLELLIKGEHYGRVPGPGMAYVERNAGDVEMTRRVAEVLVTPRVYDAGLAVKAYAALPETNVGALARRASLLALAMNRVEEAERVSQEASKHAASDADRRAALIAAGDVELARSAFDKAGDYYRRAEAIVPQKRTDPSVLARLGTYPWAVEDYTARQELVEAFDTLAEWEENFPSQKLESTSFLLRGKVLYLAQRYEAAARFFELCYLVAPEGPNAPEAVWLRASSLHQLKRFDEAVRLYEVLQTQFTKSEYAAKLPQRIEQAKKKEGP